MDFYCLFLSVRLEILFSSASSEEPIFTASLCNIYFSSFDRNMIEVIFLGIYEYFTNCRSAPLTFWTPMMMLALVGVITHWLYRQLTIPARLIAPEVFVNAESKTYRGADKTLSPTRKETSYSDRRFGFRISFYNYNWRNISTMCVYIYIYIYIYIYVVPHS